MSSSLTFAKYICGFNVKRLNDFNDKSSSLSYFINLNGILFSKASFDFSRALNSIRTSFSLVV